MGRGSDNNLLYGPVQTQPLLVRQSTGQTHVDQFSPLLQPLLFSLNNQEPDYRSIYNYDEKATRALFDDYSHNETTPTSYSGTIDLLLKGERGDNIPEFTRPENMNYLKHLDSLENFKFSDSGHVIRLIEEMESNSQATHSEIYIQAFKDHPSQGKILSVTPTHPEHLEKGYWQEGTSYFVSLAQMMAVEKHYGNDGKWTFEANKRGLYYSVKGRNLAFIYLNTIQWLTSLADLSDLTN